MTLNIYETQLTVQFTLNLTGLSLTSAYVLRLKSQYSHQVLDLDCQAMISNERYTTFQVTFPTGFGDEHKNGVYYFDMIEQPSDVLFSGLVKIITEPGGAIGTVEYEADIYTEDRVADVYYRPNY